MIQVKLMNLKLFYHKELTLWKKSFPNNFTGRPRKQWKGHKSPVTCLQFDDRVIVSGSVDGEIKVWSIQEESELGSLDVTVADEGKVSDTNIRSLQFDDKFICFARGNALQLWQLEEREFFFSFEGQISPQCLQFDERKIVSGGLDGKLFIWDVRMGDEINSFSVGSEIYALQYENDNVFCGGKDGSVSVLDLRNGAVVGNFVHRNTKRPPGAASKLYIDNSCLVSGHETGIIVVWERESKNVLYSLEGHGSCVTCIQCDNSMVVASSVDSSSGLMIWDYARQDDMFGTDMLELDFTPM